MFNIYILMIHSASMPHLIIIKVLYGNQDENQKLSYNKSFNSTKADDKAEIRNRYNQKPSPDTIRERNIKS